MADVVLFDGECAYCNGWVRWIMARDRRKRFRFEPLDGPQGRLLRETHHVPPAIDSVVLVRDGRAFTKSAAAWRILATLPGWGLVSWLMRLVPRPLRDLVYDAVARNRHRLAGPDTCELPGPH